MKRSRYTIHFQDGDTVYYCDECGHEYCVCGWNCDEDDYDLGDPNERIIP